MEFCGNPGVNLDLSEHVRTAPGQNDVLPSYICFP